MTNGFAPTTKARGFPPHPDHARTIHLPSLIPIQSFQISTYDVDSPLKAEIRAREFIDGGDCLWQSGRVYVPQGCGSWPGGIYARDMAFAFKEIFSSKGSDDEVADRFRRVFPNVTYVKATLYRQRTFWVDTTQSERDVGENMARDGDGLWTKWRAASSGHQKFKSKKAKSG
ncbi:hypothetical protein B0H14DRAFT_2599927 [Mycena olivaceomarginata]|nr:hypothetical protein B0H14DRAFT_2599927 [Mycena olivaceomarginata]